MEIVFDKTKKILLSLVLTLLFISITTSVFAANTFKLNIASATIYEGKEIQLTADEQRVTWTSSDPSKATVNSSGKVKAIKKGTVTITAEKSGEKHSCEIKINKQNFIDKLRGITMNATAVTLYEGEKLTLKANGANKWTTTMKSVLTVDSGNLEAKKPGIAIVSAKAGSKTATCWVTVKKADKTETPTPAPTPAPAPTPTPAPKPQVKVQSIRLDYPYKDIENITEITIKKDTSFTLAAEVTPSNAANKQVEWKSSNTNVATVEQNGKVTGKAAGTATITATAKDGSGKKATCTVTVLNNKKFRFTYYTKEECGTSTTQSGKNDKNFGIDPTLGCYTYNGKVVLASATNLLAQRWGVTKKSYIKYFDLYDEVKFTYNGKEYTGIILDGCGASMDPAGAGYVGADANMNILDMFFPTNKAANNSGINQKKLTVHYK